MAGIGTQASGVASGSQASESLRAIARGEYDGDWERTKPDIKSAILSAVSIYQSRGPPRTRQSAPSPSENQTQLSTTDTSSLPNATDTRFSPTSPTISTTQIQTDDPPSDSSSSSNGHNNNNNNNNNPSPLIGPILPGSGLGSSTATDDMPSTPGGLVIPPFPPLDPNRRKRSGSASSSEGGREKVSHILVSRANGVGHPAPPIRIATGNVFEDEYDEDVVIGGKKRPGWMSEAAGQNEATRLVTMLDDIDEPPFTIQRLAEILSNPTSTYASLGKFLRAVEKMMLVQTPWQPQSYIPEPENLLSSSSKTTYDPSLPPLMSTPKFSPIPWLHPPTGEGGDGDGGMEAVEARMPGRSMSPLVLADSQESEAREEGGDGADGLRLEGSSTDLSSHEDETQAARSPTPEPENPPQLSTAGVQEDIQMTSNTSETPATTTATTTQIQPIPMTDTEPQPSSADPGNQPYLGRVDELDTGPIQSNPSASGGNGNGRGGREDEHVIPGTGEGGAMTPHGMSEKPVPISSTTVISEEERRIAGLRQGSPAGTASGGDPKTETETEKPL